MVYSELIYCQDLQIKSLRIMVKIDVVPVFSNK